MAVQHCIMSTDEEAAELEAEKLRTGMSKTDILLSRATQSGAWRASRTRSGPITASTVAAEEANKLRLWMGAPHCPDTWPYYARVLADMGIINADQHTEMFGEMVLRRPDVVAAAYTLHQSNLDAAPLVCAAFDEWRTEEPEAFLGTFSKSDLTLLLVAENTTFDAALAANANNAGQLLEMHAGEAERSDPSRMRAHARRILRRWRESNIEWPHIDVDHNGTPYLSTGTRVEFVFTDGRRQPILVSTPVEPDNRNTASLDPVLGYRAPITPYSSGRVGAAPEEAAARALTQRSSPKISGE